MSVRKKTLFAAMIAGLCITASAASVGEYELMEFLHPATILLAFLLLCSNLRRLGPHKASTFYIGLGFLCLIAAESARFINRWLLHTAPYTPLIRLIYVLPSVFFAINETIFFHKKLSGRSRDLSYVYTNSFCFSMIGMIAFCRAFLIAVGGIRDYTQLAFLIIMFFGVYVAVMCLQTFFIIGKAQMFRETLLITGAMFFYELLDIRYLFVLAISREPDRIFLDIVYLLLVVLMAAGVTIQTEKGYEFEFLKREHNEKTIRRTIIVSLAIITAAVLLALTGAIHGTDASYIVIVLMANLIMSYLLYVGELREQENEKLEQMVQMKTRELTVANVQLLTAKAAAEDASKAKSDFHANMSHEIRTPINAILGMNELLLREITDPLQRKYAFNIQRAGKALLSQVNDILDFSRIEAGKMELVNDEYDLAMTLGDIAGLISSRAAQKGLSFVTDINETIPHALYGDSVRISQVITNLLTNAVKYTREGHVILQVNYQKADAEHIDLHVAVKDTGIGIKEADIAKIFHPFERVDEIRNKTIEGTGLGMNIVLRLLAMMDSGLDVESEYGKGSVFSFSIRQKVLNWEPLGAVSLAAEEQAEKPTVYHSAFFAPDAKLLLVDDTEMNLMVVKGLLQNTGLSIDTAADGKQALSMTEKKEYDILMIDHRMPVMDGMEMIEKLRANRYNPNSAKPCVVLTANAVAGAKDDYLAAGFDDYLVKPVNGSRLELTLRKYLPPEKVKETDQSAAAPVDMEPDLAALEENGYLNVREGIEYAGSMGMYRRLLHLFVDTLDEKSEEIRTHYEKANWPDYQTKVHALKSSAKIMGAEELSNRARALELAAKDKDYDYIREHTGDVLAFYKSYREKIRLSEEQL